ncbi:MAG: hypothetical protein KDB03_13135 [Planctomycetales bacterium]|nr:hypothetical protein [Planctomycetales bacterium]
MSNLQAKSRLAFLALLCLAAVSASANAQTLTSLTPGRKLAPDVLEVIPPGIDYGDTFQGPIDLELVGENSDLAWVPNYVSESETLLKKASDVVFRGDAYGLQFAFKPVRMMETILPGEDGQAKSAIVWYLLYRVRNVGGDLRPTPEADPFGNQVFGQPTKAASTWVRFMPRFRLRTLGANSRTYLDPVLPSVKAAIAAKERVGQPIFDSIEMQRQKIELSTEAETHDYWGVATWVNVDPRTDFFRIEVSGLTNAQRLVLDEGRTKYLQKTLVLHFTRPGDTVNELEDVIRYGIPAIDDAVRQKYVLDQFGLQDRLDHMWIYQ